MGYVYGLALMFLGLMLGIWGERILSLELMVSGGLFVAAGLAAMLLLDADNGEDGSPGSHIRP